MVASGVGVALLGGLHVGGVDFEWLVLASVVKSVCWVCYVGRLGGGKRRWLALFVVARIRLRI